MGIEKKVFSVRLDQSLLDDLRSIAKDENRPLSNLVETILKKYVKNNSSNAETKK